MSDPISIHKSSSQPAAVNEEFANEMRKTVTNSSDGSVRDEDLRAPSLSSSPSSPGLSRSPSFTGSNSFQEDWDIFPPLDKMTIFDVLENFALPQKLEKWQSTLAAQSEKVRKQREKLRTTSRTARDKMVGEWRRRVPSTDERLEKYKKQVKGSVDRLNKQWSDSSVVTAREKASFIGGVLNIFISGYMIGACPEYFYLWYAAQLCYFMPVRFYTYHKKGYHYFLADLCYFVNFLMLLSLFAFPQSKRLFISTYCLAYGNNAVAIAMWRNSLVFHSLDKVTSLFVHIMPPVAFHCLVHLTSAETLQEKFPAIYNVKFSSPDSPEHYSLPQMIVWATVPYMVWQLAYHFLITVRRREKIAAGRPTSFTWLRKSYAKTWLGKIVLGLPEFLQEPAFMLIQYSYALVTMVPCPIWFWYRWASTIFLSSVFAWSIYNGATYYIDVFGNRFKKELEQLKQDVSKWQNIAENGSTSPILGAQSGGTTEPAPLKLSKSTADLPEGASAEVRKQAVDTLPLVDGQTGSTGVSKSSSDEVARERK